MQIRVGLKRLDFETWLSPTSLEGIFDILFCLLEAQVVPSEATLCPQVFWSVGEKKKRNMG
jgi:hypothetical protein